MLRIAERERITLAFELLNNPSLVNYCLGDDGVGEQLVGNNRLFLVHRAVGPKDSAASDVQMRGEIMEMLRLIGFVGHRSTQLLAVNPTQQIDGPQYTPEFTECAVDSVAATIAVQAGENPGGLDTPTLDGERDAQELLPVRLNQRPIDDTPVEMGRPFEAQRHVWTIQLQAAPTANTRHQLNAEQVCKPKQGSRLSVRIGVDPGDYSAQSERGFHAIVNAR